MSNQLRELTLAEVHNNPLQPRFGMSEEVIAGAKAAILESGNSYPTSMAITVRPRAAGGFEIIAGHHRTEAARALSLETVWAHVQELDDREAAIALAATNNQQSMSPLEHARHALRLVEDFDISIAEYSRRVGKHANVVYSYVNAYKLLEEFGGLEGQYRDVPVQALTALCSVKEPNQRAALLYQFKQRRTSGPQAETVVKAVREGKPMREAFDEAEGRVKVAKGSYGSSGHNVNAAASNEKLLAHVNQELISGFEWTLALFQARAEEYEARFGQAVAQGVAKDAFLDAVASRQRKILAELKRNPKPMLQQPPSTKAEPKCATCFHGKANSFSETGFQCEVGRARECMPFTQARFWVEREV